MTPTYWALTSRYKQSEIQILQYSKGREFTLSNVDYCLITLGVRGAALTSRMETAALKCGAWVRGPTPQTILAPPQQRPQAMMLFISFEHTLKVHKAITKAIFQTKV